MQKTSVISHFGGVRPTARAMTEAGYRVSAAWVCEWPEVVPELYARRLHEMTRGRLRFDPEVYREAV